MTALELTPGEEARLIPGFTDYLVTSVGRVFNTRTGCWCRLRKDRRGGYMTASISFGPSRWARKWRTRKVHQLVLEAFVGPRPRGCVSRHLNDQPSDNRRENLLWGTPRDNLDDSRRNRGLPALPPRREYPTMRGERNPQAKLSEEQVREIRTTHRPYCRKGRSFHAFARRFGVTPTAVRLAALRENWMYS